jgi:hypothetical protein
MPPKDAVPDDVAPAPLPTETTVQVSITAPALKATVEYLGGGTVLTTVTEVDPRFDALAPGPEV